MTGPNLVRKAQFNVYFGYRSDYLISLRYSSLRLLYVKSIAINAFSKHLVKLQEEKKDVQNKHYLYSKIFPTELKKLYSNSLGSCMI